MIKIIAIGNRLMGDDGVGLVVLEKIKDELVKLSSHIEVIIGETDYMYCLTKIHDEDIVIVLDSAFFGYRPGKVILRKFPKNDNRQVFNSQHQVSLPELIHQYNDHTLLYTIGIEVYEIDYQSEISNILYKKLNQINKKVIKYVKKVMKENDYA